MIRDILGAVGSVFTGLCCIGFAPALGVLSAIGAGFLARDIILIPLFMAFLGITLWGLRKGSKCHGNGKVFGLGLLSALVAITTIWFSPLMTYIALTGLVVASAWDIYLIKTCKIVER